MTVSGEKFSQAGFQNAQIRPFLVILTPGVIVKRFVILMNDGSWPIPACRIIENHVWGIAAY
jgi:hypothetical protein